MGNTQSAEAPRRPSTKLTKPRTNTSTTNLLGISSAPSRRTSNLDLAVAANKCSSTLSTDAVHSGGSDAVVKGKPGSHPKRRSFFRSKSAQAESTSRVEENSSNVAGSIASLNSNRFSTLGTLQVEMPVDVPADARYGADNVRPSIRDSRTAPVHPRRSHSTLRLSLVVETQSPQPEPQEGAKQLAARAGSFDDRTSENTTARTENPLQSMPIPIRRRSLLTPGIATRANSKDNPYFKALPPRPISPVSAMTDDTGSERIGKRFSFRRSLPAQSAPSSPVMDDNSSGKIGKRYSFRKSLPGQSTPSTNQLRDYYYTQSKPKTSPPKELAALEPPRIEDPHPRTATPNDLDYGHIGAFKLGSLRITNGAASPTPSSKTRFFDAVSPLNTESVEGRHAPSKLQSEIEQDMHARDSEDHINSAVVDEIQSLPENLQLPDESSRIAEITVEIPRFSLDLTDFKSGESVKGDNNLQSPTRAYEIAQEYMQEIASSPFSFEESLPPTPRLEPTSKHTAMEDNLFDDEADRPFHTPSTSLYNPNPSLSQDLTVTRTPNDMLVVPKVWKNDSQRGRMRPVQGSREPAAKPLEKSDSGYSSKTSLRSFKSHILFNETESAPKVSTTLVIPDKNPPTPPKNSYVNVFDQATAVSIASRSVQSLDAKHAPATPTKDWLSSSSLGGVGNPDTSTPVSPAEDFSKKELPQPPDRQAPPVPLKQDSIAEIPRRERPPLPLKSIEQTRAAALSQLESSDAPQRPIQTRRQSSPAAVTTAARPPLTTSGSDTSISSTNRRLQKCRPARPASFIVQGYREIEPDRIPPISRDVEEHLDERLKNFPLLTHTYKTVHRTNSKETLATIFSITSSEQRLSRFDGHSPISLANEDIEDSTLNDSDATKPANTERFSNVRKMFRRSTDGVRGRRRSADAKTRNRSSSKDEHEFSIQDLAAVSRRLGGSPYDHAFKALDSSSPKGPRGPSQSNRRRERSRTRGRITGMDSESAAQYARNRSRMREELREQNMQYNRQYDIPVRQVNRRRNSVDGRSEFLGQIPVAIMANRAAPPVPSLSYELVKNPAVSVSAKSARPLSYEVVKNGSMPKKTKSPPPVSMNVKRKQVAIPQPFRNAPVVPGQTLVSSSNMRIDARVSYETQDEQWKKEVESRQNGQRSAHDPVDFNSSTSERNRPSFEQQQQQQSSPSFHTRRSFEQQLRYAQSPAQQPHSRSLQDQGGKEFCPTWDFTQPRPEVRKLGRASFDSSIGSKDRVKNAQPLNNSSSLSQLPRVPVNVDRYNGGFDYGYETGFGIGGSAGTRNSVTLASRKGVEGSLLWGVDFSDVPIMVQRVEA